MYKTEVLENAISDSDIEKINVLIDEHLKSENVDIVTSGVGSYYDVGHSATLLINNLIEKLPNEMLGIRMLDAICPGGPHPDTSPPNNSDNTNYTFPNFARTFIIPLSDCDTNTIVFNEHIPNEVMATHHPTGQNVTEYVETKLQRIGDTIDDETRNKYLSHVSPSFCSHISIDKIFPWKKGSMLIFDRKILHCSDNYSIDNLKVRRGLVIWSEIK